MFDLKIQLVKSSIKSVEIISNRIGNKMNLITKSNILYIVSFLIIILVTSALSRAITSDELTKICETMESTYQDITIEYEWLVEPSPTIEDLKENGIGGFITIGPEKMKWSAKHPFEKWSLSESIATYMDEDKNTFQTIIMQSYNGKVAKHFSRGGMSVATKKQVDFPIGTITDQRDFMESLSSTPLSFSVFRLRYEYENRPLFERLQKKEFVRIVDPNEKINGFDVICIEFLWDAPNIPILHKKEPQLRVYFSKDHGYTPVKYEYMTHTGTSSEPRYAAIVTSLEQVADGLWFPDSAYFIDLSDNLTNKYQASKILVNQKLSDDYFDIKFPPGTRVDNEITGIRYAQAENEIQSLVGKSLPVLADLGIELKKEEIENKRILVCFFDYEQRPSRNCILELNKKENELKENNIFITAINASGADKNVLNKWIKENKIAFPVGKIESDIEKTKATWGVQSLPWLILTDKEHIVTDEGFGISQLDEKMKQ